MLTQAQKDSARWHGEGNLSNRRRHVRALRTSLMNLRTEDKLPEDDYTALQQAGRVLDRMLNEIEADIKTARFIKRDYDTRIAAAKTALATLPQSSVADIVALGELARELGSPALLLDGVERCGWPYMAASIKRAAIDWLAHRCVSEGKTAAEIAAAMPEAAARHADLIRQINTLAVAHTLQQTT